ncbi:MAG TPA: protein phosphatase 2C domain-containing protein [Streptosporangiaceae bacterium]|nr:protein phosphatase 2C domain-containing protein [Streptosporangiaceae bacterium]
MTLALRYAVRSDVGLLREGNEDSAYAGPHLLAVADGMGGYEAGEVASAAVISTVAPLDRTELAESDLMDALGTAVTTAKQTLRHIVDSDPAVGSMGTTLTAMLWSGGIAAVCHIGDSRAYLLRDGELYQITRDHTFVQALVDQGRIRPDEVATHPQRSLLLRALDGRSDADPDLSMLTAQLGDRYLLCSDGLPVAVSDELILQALSEVAEPGDAVLQLIELAIHGGAPDNVTCIVADVIDAATSPLAPTTAPVVAGAAAAVGGHDTRPIARPAAPENHGVTQLGALSTASSGLAGTVPAGRQTAPGQARSDPAPAMAARSSRHAARGGDDDDPPPARRRWPVMTSVLALVVLLIAGGLLIGYRYTQSQYYIGADHGQVVVFRGINQSVLGISLSSVHQRTGIPLSGVPTNDLAEIRDATIAGGLTQVQRSVAAIRKGYRTCLGAYANLRQWVLHKPKPHKQTEIRNGRKRVVTVTPKYRPKPLIPSDCPPQPRT